MAGPRLSDSEIENFIAAQKEQLRRERERVESQRPNNNQYSNRQPAKVAATREIEEPGASRYGPPAPVLRERDPNAARFDKIVRVDGSGSAASEPAMGSLPIEDRRNNRERLKAEMNREYNEYLRAQEDRTRARRQGQQQPSAATAALPPPAPRRNDNAGMFSAPAPAPNAAVLNRTFLTETEQQIVDDSLSPNSIELGLALNSIQSSVAPRRDPQLEELAERVRELRSITSGYQDSPLDLSARLGGAQFLQPAFHQSSPMLASNPNPNPMQMQPPMAASPAFAAQPGQAQGDNYFATLPIRDRISAKERAVEQRKREYNEYLRLKEQSEQQRSMARRSGGDGDGLQFPSQTAQFVPAGYGPMQTPGPAIVPVDSRFVDVEAAMDRTKRLYGMQTDQTNYASRPVPHLVGSRAVPVNPINSLGDPQVEDRRRRQAEYGRELLAQAELSRESRRRARSADMPAELPAYAGNARNPLYAPAAPQAAQMPYGYAFANGAPQPQQAAQFASPMQTLASSFGAAQADLYNFYAARHPLDLNAGAPPPMGNNFGNSNSLNAPGVASSNFDALQKVRADAMNSGIVFASEDERKQLKRAKEQAYQAELQRQVQEALVRKQRDVEEFARYNARKDAETATYFPFGRSGGGAPLKDRSGQVVTDLRRLRDSSPSDDTAQAGFGGAGPGMGMGSGAFGAPPMPPPGAMAQTLASLTAADSSPRAPNLGSPTRGGHGIFGTPLTDEQKAAADRYKDDLKNQIDEKRARAEAEKMRQAEEDAREERRIVEQQERIQREVAEEERKRKAKEEAEERRKQEMEKQLAAAAEQNASKRKRERVPTRMSKQGPLTQSQASFRPAAADDTTPQPVQLQPQLQPRVSSPPVPAVRNRNRNGPPMSSREEALDKSRDRDGRESQLDTQRTAAATATAAAAAADREAEKAEKAAQRERVAREARRAAEAEQIAREREELEHARAELARERERDARRSHRSNGEPSEGASRASSRLEVIGDLAKLRSMLRNEHSRVENELEAEAHRESNETPDRSETRTIVRHSPPPIDMIDLVSHRYPVMVNRKRAGGARHNKDKDRPPAQDSALDRQIETQRRRIDKLKGRTVFDQDVDEPVRPRNVLQTPSVDENRLKSDTAWLDVDSHAVHIPGKDDAPLDLFGGEKRRSRGDLGSATSINPDRMSRKNERRLRNLKEAAARSDAYTLEDSEVLLEKYVHGARESPDIRRRRPLDDRLSWRPVVSRDSDDHAHF